MSHSVQTKPTPQTGESLYYMAHVSGDRLLFTPTRPPFASAMWMHHIHTLWLIGFELL